MSRRLTLTSATAICLALAGTGMAAPAPITIGTGPIGGFAYPLGGELCRLFEGAGKDKARCVVAATDGSVDNLTRLREGELTFAVVQSDVAADAVGATGPFAGGKPFPELRSVAGFYSQALTVLVRADGTVKQADDLKGQRVAVGAPGQPEPLFTEYLEGLGWGKAALGGIVEMPRNEQIAALCNGKIAAIAVTAPHPNGFVREALTACKVALLDLTGPALDAVVGSHPAYGATRLDLSVYDGQTGAVQSFGPRAVLMTTANLEDATVERLLTGLVHHVDDLRKAHPAFVAIDAAAIAAPTGLGADRHPAATKYLTDNKTGDDPSGK